MLHNLFPIQMGLYNEVTTVEDNLTIQSWVLNKLQDVRHIDIDRDDTSIEATFIKNTFMRILQEYLDNTHYDFNIEKPILSDISANRFFKCGPEFQEWDSPYIMHNDLTDGDITLVYYPLMPQGQGADLMFYSPSSMANFNYYDSLCYQPQERDVVVFPSHILHRVTPYWGDTPRVSIAAMYRFDRLEKTSRPPMMLKN